MNLIYLTQEAPFFFTRVIVTTDLKFCSISCTYLYSLITNYSIIVLEKNFLLTYFLMNFAPHLGDLILKKCSRCPLFFKVCGLSNTQKYLNNMYQAWLKSIQLYWYLKVEKSEIFTYRRKDSQSTDQKKLIRAFSSGELKTIKENIAHIYISICCVNI